MQGEISRLTITATLVSSSTVAVSAAAVVTLVSGVEIRHGRR
jgi:hypothetical protein